MPIYEYECKPCAVVFEQLVRSPRDERTVRCPDCGGGAVTRKLSVFAARSAAAPRPPAMGCGRCGDPNGPCGSE